MSTLGDLKACVDPECESTLHYKLYEKGDTHRYIEWLMEREEGET